MAKTQAPEILWKEINCQGNQLSQSIALLPCPFTNSPCQAVKATNPTSAGMEAKQRRPPIAQREYLPPQVTSRLIIKEGKVLNRLVVDMDLTVHNPLRKESRKLRLRAFVRLSAQRDPGWGLWLHFSPVTTPQSRNYAVDGSVWCQGRLS